MIYTRQALRQLRRGIGVTIHVYRVQHRITLQKLAHHTQLPVDLLDRYELGKGEITLEALFRIACALDITLSALIADEEGII